MPRQSKPCLNCGKIMHFADKKSMSEIVWARLKCCSLSCGAFYRNKKPENALPIDPYYKYTEHNRPDQIVTIDAGAPLFMFMSGKSRLEIENNNEEEE